MTQLERAGANNSPLALSYLVAFKWCPECEPPGSSKAAGSLSREVIQVENLCLSAPQCRLPTYYESFHLLFDGTGSDLCPWLDHINVVVPFWVWTIIHTLFSLHIPSASYMLGRGTSGIRERFLLLQAETMVQAPSCMFLLPAVAGSLLNFPCLIF